MIIEDKLDQDPPDERSKWFMDNIKKTKWSMAELIEDKMLEDKMAKYKMG